MAEIAAHDPGGFVRRLVAVLSVATCVVALAGGITATSASAAVRSTAPAVSAVAASQPAKATTAASSLASSTLHKTFPKQVVRLGPDIAAGARSRLIRPRVTLSDPITARINVQYSGFPPAARTAFQAAVDIWARSIHSSVEIDVLADWSNLSALYGPDVLGAAGPSDFVANFTDSGHAQPNVYYPVALANAISGKDQLPASSCTSDNVGNTSGADILASFNSSPSKGWYYGTDGGVDVEHVDLESVVLHELGHGLGFVGTYDGLNPVTGNDEGKGYFGLTGTGTSPVIFDKFVTDGQQHALGSGALSNGTGSNPPAIGLGDVLRGANGGANWNGANGKAAYGGHLIPLFSPYPWEEGSSFSHLDEDAFPGGNNNALMTPQLSPGESEHDPGPVLLGMFKDMGWPDSATVPGLAGLYHPVSLVPTPRVAHQSVLHAGTALDVPVAGQFGVPSNPTAVIVNVEIVAPTAAGYWSALPGCKGGPGRPDSGDYAPGTNRTAQVTLPVNTSGHIQVWLSAGSADVNVDVIGWYGTTGDLYYHHLQNQQVASLSTVVANHEGDVLVAGKAGIPSTGATAVVLKARVSNGTAKGYLVVGPGGVNSRVPTQSFAAGEMISEFLTVPLGTGSFDGKVHLRLTAGTAKVSLEAVGWYGTSTAGGTVFHPAGPGRLPTLSGSDQTISGLPDSAQVQLTVHLAKPTAGTLKAPGWLGNTNGGALHGVQEYRAGVPVSGTIVASTSAVGKVRLIMSQGKSTMYIDVEGWFTAT
jgi:hypothetical protein